MITASRGTAVLTVGVAAVLLFGVLSAAVAATQRGDMSSVAVLKSWFTEAVTVDVVDPWFAAYDQLPGPKGTTELAARGIRWQVEPRDERCVLLRSERTASLEVASAPLERCEIAGASVDGRFVTLDGTERVSNWMLYDDRPRLLRPVPRPVVDGEWLAVDPTRTMGLYRGRIRSTQSAGVATWFWLTDGVGAALWAGDQSLVDANGRVTPLTVTTRPDGAILLSYRLDLPDGAVVQRLALHSGRAGAAWKPVDTSVWNAEAAIWRLQEWERGAKGWEAVANTIGADGEARVLRVRTP